MLWLLLVCLWTLLQLESVQTYIAKKSAVFLSEELQTHIEIERVKLRLFKYVELDDLLIEDQRGDTLIYLKSLSIDLLTFSIYQDELNLGAILEKPHVHLVRNADESDFNYQFLIDYFSSNDSTSESNFLISSDRLEVSNGQFSLHDYHEEDTSSRMDYNHVEVGNLNLVAEEIWLKGGDIAANIKELGLKTPDNFELDCFSAQLKIEPELLSFQSMKIQTYNTELYADITFTAHSFEAYKNFIDEVFISADFKNSLIELADIAYFVPQMTQISNRVLLNGKVTGTVGNLSSKDFELHLNKNTYLMGEFDIRGLPEIEETFIFFEADEIHTNAQGLRNLPFRSFIKNFTINIPKEVERLGDVNFDGNFTGYLADFVAYGTFETALGSFGSDISLSQNDGRSYYDGSLSAKKFNLGALLAKEDIGDISFNLDLDGKGITLDEIAAKATGKVSSAVYKGYRYNNIDLNGEFSSKRFNGKLSVQDENLKLDFEGGINADSTVLVSRFKLRVDEARLANLNLFNQEDTLTNVTFQAHFNILGSQLEELDGNVYFDSLHYADKNLNYKTDTVFLQAKALEKGRDLYFSSSFLEARMNGEFKLAQISDLIKNDLQRQIPGEDLQIGKIDTQDFEYEITIKKFRPITDIFIPALRVDSGTTIQGSFNNVQNVNTLQLNSPGISYGDYKLKKLILTAGGNLEGVSISVNSRAFYLSDHISLSDYHLSASLEKGNGKLYTFWEGINDNYERGQVQVEARIDSFDVMNFQFKDSYFYLNDSLWEVKGNNYVELRGKEVLIDSISIGNKTQGILVDGRISENEHDSLLLTLQDFDLNYLSTFIPSEDLSLEGSIYGRAVLRDPYNKRVIISDLKAENLFVNDFKIGGAAFESFWLKDSTGIVINSYIGPRNNPLIKVNGKLNPKLDHSNLDLDLRINRLPIALSEPFIDHILSDLDGYISGMIAIKGTTDLPLLKGELQLDNAIFRVNYLNTSYTINHNVLIRPDFIGFDLMRIEDENGAFAIATGTIFHQNYQKFNLDIGMDMENFLGMNTSKRDNELFYGKAIVSGWANISEYADQLIFEMNLSAKAGTDFKIPIKDDVSVSSNEFLVFTNSPKFDEDSAIKIDLSGIQLNFELDIEPEAKTTIIFDESIGDVIKARGVGKLKMEINTLGNFNMSGQYELTEGEYLFTLQNIVNKKFQLSPGSKMMWDGDPYQARLDIQAVYNLRASLYSLMPEDSTGRYRRRVPVELILNLGGYLLSPEITFDIKIPSADDLVQSRLESILYVNQNNVNEQELNQQVFGLLLLGRFMPPSTGNTGGTASKGAPGMNNGYELLSNQLSNWISSMSNEFDVGVSYRPADAIAEEELDVSLTTELLDDRLILDGTFGYVADRQASSDGNASSFIGEFMIEYKLKRDGKLRIRGFNRSNNYDPLQINSLYTQGVGLFYQEEYDEFSEVWRKYFRKSKIEE